MIRPPAVERALPWLLRLTWVGVLVAGGAALDGATVERSEAVAATARWGGMLLWVAGVAAMAVPAVVSLTATRTIVPLALPAAVMSWVAGADAVDAALFGTVAAAACVIVMSAEVGRRFVQASSYGDEDRHPLRPPVGAAVAAGLAWSLWAAAVLAGPLLLAARQWILGSVVTGLAIAGSVWLPPRWHRLARRWLVFVPIGIVVHDDLVLAETIMLRRNQIAAIHLARADTGAADLTGPASGHAIEIVTNDSITVVRAGPPSNPIGPAIHLTACLVGPTRPGRALTAAGARRLPVG